MASCARPSARCGGTTRKGTSSSSTAPSSAEYEEGGRYLLEIQQRAEQQDGEMSAMGSAIVELPKR